MLIRDNSGQWFGHLSEKRSRRRPGVLRKVTKPLTGVIPDEHRLEMVWTLVPGVILFILAVAQIQTWLQIKDRNWMPKPGELPLQMEVSASSFDGRSRIPAPNPLPNGKNSRTRTI